MTRAKSAMAKEDAEKRMKHAQSLECQGQVFRCSKDGAASIWSKAVQKLPPELLKFSLNAVQDTLPHNANLAMWRRREGLSSAYKLRGGKLRGSSVEGSNNCSKALNMRRYNEWHDAVLEVISKFMAKSLPEEYQLLADLPQFQPYVSTPHCHNSPAARHCSVKQQKTRGMVIELTVCFETRYEDAHTD